MEQWIEEYIRRLKSMYKLYKDREKALTTYIACMIRMLNGLAEMDHTQFHTYERQTLWRAMQLFTQYFFGQIEEAERSESVEEKKLIIDDIEDSVSKILRVYQNVVDGTANTDRQMLSGVSIDTNMYELSPKLCAFYSNFLEALVKMFGKDGSKYAFILHPTICSNTEMELLFKRRKKTGKIVIVYISESMIEELGVVPIYLLHEAFHVLTGAERNRKIRMECFVAQMMAGISQLLFCGVSFEGKEETKIKNELLMYWFGTVVSEKEELKKCQEDKLFYSKNIKQWIVKTVRNCLAAIDEDLSETLRRVFCNENKEQEYKEFETLYKKAEKIEKQIKHNLTQLLYNNSIEEWADLLLLTYREAYSDIACILTLRLSAEMYKTAFLTSVYFDYSNKRYIDRAQKIRAILVSETVAIYFPQKQSEEWKKYALDLRNELQSETKQPVGEGERKSEKKDESGQEKMARQLSGKCGMIGITHQMEREFSKYLNECAMSLQKRLDAIEDTEMFRKNVQNILKAELQEILPDILIGNMRSFVSDRL